MDTKNEFFKKICISFLTVTISFVCACSHRSGGGSSDSPSTSLSLSLLAGVLSLTGNVNATGTNASFDFPFHVASDGTNLYVADQENNLIRKIVISTGVVSTFAGSGTGASVDGTGTAASFYFPSGIATDGTNLYVAENGNNVIRQIVISTRAVTTLAGTAGVTGSSDGTGSAAEFDSPNGLTVAGGNLYVADLWNNNIRKIVISTGVVTTFAGDGTCGANDATGTSASFCHPAGLTNDGTYLYVADTDNSAIRKIDISNAAVTTLAGNAGTPGYNDATGTSAEFRYPENLTYDSGFLYVLDSQNFIVRKVDASSGAVTTFAGTQGNNAYANGVGAAIAFGYYTSGITTDGTNLYIAEAVNGTIRKIVISTVTATTFAGSPYYSTIGATDGTGSAARFNYIQGMASDGTNLYVSDNTNHTIRKIVVATGVTTTFAGTAGSSGSTDATGTSASFDRPNGIVYVGGYLYVADAGNNLIRRVSTSTGAVTTFAGDGTDGYNNAIGTAAQFSYPMALATDGTYVYVAGNSAIQKIQISNATVTAVAGTSGSYGNTDGTGGSVQLGSINAMAVDSGNLYLIGDFNNVRKVVISSGTTSTVAGSTIGTPEFTDGVGTAARFFYATGIAAYNSNLYIADQGNNSIRVMNTSTNAVTTLVGSMSSEFDRLGALGSTASLSNPNVVLYDSTLGLFIGSDSSVKRIH